MRLSRLLARGGTGPALLLTLLHVVRAFLPVAQALAVGRLMAVLFGAAGDHAADGERGRGRRAPGDVLDRVRRGVAGRVNDGTDLSGGQWQRVALARALFAVAAGRRLLVLDEPTASLDVRAEAEFHERVVAKVGDATIVLISHRLSTVRFADRIILLRDGRVAEDGTHEEPVALGGGYADLYRLQERVYR